MTARRTAASSLAALALLTGLAGCEKPTPGVTLVSSGRHVRAEATSFCRDGQSAQKQNCVLHTGRLTVLEVRDGATVGVDVDRALARSGWVVVDADAKQRSAVQDTHYFTFGASFADRPTKGVINLQVQSLSKAAENAAVTGIWRFQLVQR